MSRQITYPFPNFNGYSVEVLEWVSNLIPHFIMDVITYASWDLSQSMLVKVVTRPFAPIFRHMSFELHVERACCRTDTGRLNYETDRFSYFYSLYNYKIMAINYKHNSFMALSLTLLMKNIPILQCQSISCRFTPWSLAWPGNYRTWYQLCMTTQIIVYLFNFQRWINVKR